MTKYNLTCDNGQVMEMNVLDIPGVTLQGEIEKLEAFFVTLIPAEGAPWPDGWPDPLPTSIVSWEIIQ